MVRMEPAVEVVLIPVRLDVFERLKALAEPLVDNACLVIERLISWLSAFSHGLQARRIETRGPVRRPDGQQR